MTNVAWGASIDPRLDYLMWSPVNPCAAQCRVRDNFLCHRRKERRWYKYDRRNPLVNSWVHCRDNDRDGPVTQQFLFKITVASVSNCFVPVASVSNCLRFSCKITLYVTRGCCILFIIFGVVDC